MSQCPLHRRGETSFARTVEPRQFDPIIAAIAADIFERIEKGASIAEAIKATREWTERAGVKWE